MTGVAPELVVSPPSGPAAKLSQMACLTWSSLQAEGKEPCPQVIGITLDLCHCL